MARFLLDTLDNGTIQEYLVTDSEGRMEGIHTVYSDAATEGVLEENQKVRNARGSQVGETFHHVARIPPVLWDRWYRETNGAIAKDKQLLLSYLQSRDFSKVRTSDKM